MYLYSTVEGNTKPQNSLEQVFDFSLRDLTYFFFLFVFNSFKPTSVLLFFYMVPHCDNNNTVWTLLDF